MSLIGAWITNIILIILFAVVLELLLPNSKIERYVKLVVGLMLLMVMLQPLLSIFQMDLEQLFKEIAKFDSDPLIYETNSIESQKIDIQSDNLAYISEYMAVQLKNDVEAQIIQQYEVVLTDVNVEMAQHTDLHQLRTDEDLLENILAVHAVFMREYLEEQRVDEVEPVVIHPIKISDEKRNSEEISQEDEKLVDELTVFLANSWMIPEEKLFVEMKGGEGKRER